MKQVLPATIAGHDVRGVLYFFAAATIFSLTNFNVVMRPQIPILYLGLLLVFIFNDRPKLRFDADWAMYVAVAALIVFIASITAKYPDHALMEAKRYRDVAIFGFAVYLAVRSDLVVWSNYIFCGIVLAFLIVAPLTLWEYISIVPEHQGSARFITPKLSQYAHIRHFSYHAFIASALASVVLLNGNQQNKLVWLVTALCVVALVLSAGRGGILAFAIFVSLYAFFKLNRRNLVKFALLSTVAVTVLLFVLALSPASALVESIFLRSNISEGLNSFSSGRISMWTQVWNASFDRPLLGFGPGGFKQIPGTPGNASQPHGILPQMLVEFGWLGSSIIMLCVVQLYRTTRSNLKRSNQSGDLAFLLKCLVVAYVAYALIDGLLFYPHPMLHLSVVLATLVALSASESVKISTQISSTLS